MSCTTGLLDGYDCPTEPIFSEERVKEFAKIATDLDFPGFRDYMFAEEGVSCDDFGPYSCMSEVRDFGDFRDWAHTHVFRSNGHRSHTSNELCRFLDMGKGEPRMRVYYRRTTGMTAAIDVTVVNGRVTYIEWTTEHAINYTVYWTGRMKRHPGLIESKFRATYPAGSTTNEITVAWDGFLKSQPQ